MQNEPVIIQSIVTALCAAAAPIFVKYGIDQNAVAGAAGTIVAAGIGVWSVRRARSKVTPVVVPEQATPQG